MRGFAIGSVLLLALVVVLIAVSIGALAIFHLVAAQQSAESRDALLLAESAVNEAISKLSTAPIGSFGRNPSDIVVYQPDITDGTRTGTVTFDTSGAHGLWSTNNLRGVPPPVPAPWDGEFPGVLQLGYNNVPVSPGYVRLIGTGTSRGVVRHVEVMVTRYHFPYAMAWSGTLTTDTLFVIGGTLGNFVASILATGALPNPFSPASVADAGTVTFTSATPATIAGGFYYAAGAAPVMPPSSVIDRSERQVSGLEVPTISLGPSTTAGTMMHRAFTAIGALGAPSTYAGSTSIPGGYWGTTVPYSPAGLTMTNTILTIGTQVLPQSLTVTGDLRLTDSVLYVFGPLTVTGNVVLNHSIIYVEQGGVGTSVGGDITGSGALVTDSNVTFSGTTHADFDPLTSTVANGFNTEVAIASLGSITVNPNPSSVGTETNMFEGLLYCGDAGSALNLNGTPAHRLLVGGALVSLGNINMTNTGVEGIQEAAFLRYATCAPAAAPDFGTTTRQTGGLGFLAVDVQSGYSSHALSAAEVTAVYSAVDSLRTANAAYAAQVVAGVDPLLNASFPTAQMAFQGAVYDPNINRYDTGSLGATFTNGGVGVTQSVFDTAAVNAGTTTEDVKNCYWTAQNLAANTANYELEADEYQTLLNGSPSSAAGAGVPGSITAYPAGLPSAANAETINLDLAIWLTRTSGTPSYAIASWRTF